jgi:hypothetical protein
MIEVAALDSEDLQPRPISSEDEPAALRRRKSAAAKASRRNSVRSKLDRTGE